MFGYNYYHSSIRRYVALFGTLFNDIHITRTNDMQFKVPISYGPADKVLTRIEGDPNLQRPAIVLPRMSFEIDSVSYDSTRKLVTNGVRAVVDEANGGRKTYQYNPVPYNIDFSLNIMVKNTDDGTQIVEQILPFFTPDWTTTVNLIPETNVVMDIPTILNSVSMSDQYESDFEARRVLTWTLRFTMKGYFFGPINKQSVIKFATVNVRDKDTEQIYETVTVRPGLDVQGNPTSLAANSIPVADIYPDDDFGYIVTIT
jgi:T4-like virus Myoviridae tail sheath stabiliser